MNMKKTLSLAITVALIIMSAATLPSGVKAYAASKEVEKQDRIQDVDFAFIERDLLKDSKELNLSDEEVKEVDKLLDDLSTDVQIQGVPAVIGAIAGVIAIVGATYAGGKYAARSLDKRGIITTKHYMKYRWVYRAAIVTSFGGVVALGFDDYHYGI